MSPLRLLLASLAGLSFPLALVAQEIPPITYRSANSGLSLAHDPGTPEYPNPEPLTVSWYLHAGRAYYLEGTDDLVNGPWQCLSSHPFDYFYAEFVRSVSLSFTSPRYFLRVRHVDGFGADLLRSTNFADSDRDGVRDLDELYGSPPTHPLDSFDTDADDLPDHWELRRFYTHPPAINQDGDPGNDVGPLHLSPSDILDPEAAPPATAFQLHRLDWLRGACAAYGTQRFWFRSYDASTRTVLLEGDQDGSLFATYAADDLARVQRIEVFPRTQQQDHFIYPPEDGRRLAPPRSVYTWVENTDPALSGFAFTSLPGHSIVIDPVTGAASVGPLDGSAGRDLLRFYDTTRQPVGAPRPNGPTVPRPFRRALVGDAVRRIPAELAITSLPLVEIGRDRFPLVLRDCSYVLQESAKDFTTFNQYPPGAAQTGWVQSRLDAEGLPQAVDDLDLYTYSSYRMFGSPLTFAQWYRGPNTQTYTVPGILASHPTGLRPPDQPITYTYGTYSQGLYPHAHDVGSHASYGRDKFTTELHARLDYTLDTRLYLAANDDCWLFINGELLPDFDRGGIPDAGVYTVLRRFGDLLASLSTETRTRLGLSADSGSCRIDVFHADRMVDSGYSSYGTAELRLLSTTPLRPVYCYRVVAETAEPRSVNYAFATDAITGLPLAPSGMTIDATTGRILWDLYQAPAATPGTYPVTVRVSDSVGNTDTQSFTITVLD